MKRSGVRIPLPPHSRRESCSFGKPAPQDSSKDFKFCGMQNPFKKDEAVLTKVKRNVIEATVVQPLRRFQHCTEQRRAWQEARPGGTISTPRCDRNFLPP
jgi:hypothetical protein